MKIGNFNAVAAKSTKLEGVDPAPCHFLERVDYEMIIPQSETSARSSRCPLQTCALSGA